MMFMTEVDNQHNFVDMQMIKINTLPFDFFRITMCSPFGLCIVPMKNEIVHALIFVICTTLQQNHIQPLTCSFSQVRQVSVVF